MNNKEQQMFVLDDYSIVMGPISDNLIIESRVGEKQVVVIIHDREKFFKELEEKRNRNRGIENEPSKI